MARRAPTTPPRRATATVLVAGLVTLLCPGAARADEPRTHDGLFLRGTLGFGGLGVRSKVDGHEAGTSGSGPSTELSLGGNVSRPIVLGGSLITFVVPNPKERDGATSKLHHTQYFGLLGPFVEVYPDARNGFSFGGLLGLAWMRSQPTTTDRPIEHERRVGAALSLSIANTWFLNDAWSLGLLVRATGGRLWTRDRVDGEAAHDAERLGAALVGLCGVFHLAMDPFVTPIALTASIALGPVGYRPPAAAVPSFAPLAMVASPAAAAPPPPVPEPKSESLSRSLPVITLGVIGVQVGTLALLAQLPPTTTNWGEGSFDQIVDNDLNGPKWDTDHWAWNYVAHPYVGSEYYLLARNRDGTWWQSLLYAAAMSTFWEMFTEAFYERPSQQDLVVTPVAGAILGELRYQAKLALRGPSGRPSATWKNVLIVVLDPVDALCGGAPLSRSRR